VGGRVAALLADVIGNAADERLEELAGVRARSF